MAGSKKNLFKAGIGFTIGNYLLKGVVFITTPIFARMMTTADYGKYGVFTSYESILFVILGLAIHSSYRNAYYKYKDRNDPKNEYGYQKYVSATMFFLLAMLLAWLCIAFIFNNGISKLLGIDKAAVYLLIVGSYAAALLNCYTADKGIHYQYKEILLISFFNTVTSVILAIVLMKTFFSSQMYMGRIVGGIIPGLIVYSVIAIRYMAKASPRGMLPGLKWGIKYSLPIVPHGLSQIILGQFDRIMILKMIGASQAGIYNFAYTIYSILAVTASSIDGIWSPWYYEKRANNEYGEIKKGSSIYILLLFAATVGVIFLSPEIIAILGGAKYKSAVYCAIPIVVGGFFSSIYNVPCQVEYYHEKTKVIAFSTASAAVLNIALNAFFIPKYGYVAAAYTTLFTYAVYFTLHYIVAWKIEKKNLFPLKPIVVYTIIITVSMTVSLTNVNNVGIRALVLAGITGAAIFYEEKHYSLVKQWLCKRKPTSTK